MQSFFNMTARPTPQLLCYTLYRAKIVMLIVWHRRWSTIEWICFQLFFIKLCIVCLCRVLSHQHTTIPLLHIFCTIFQAFSFIICAILSMYKLHFARNNFSKITMVYWLARKAKEKNLKHNEHLCYDCRTAIRLITFGSFMFIVMGCEWWCT